MANDEPGSRWEALGQEQKRLTEKIRNGKNWMRILELQLQLMVQNSCAMKADALARARLTWQYEYTTRTLMDTIAQCVQIRGSEKQQALRAVKWFTVMVTNLL